MAGALASILLLQSEYNGLTYRRVRPTQTFERNTSPCRLAALDCRLPRTLLYCTLLYTTQPLPLSAPLYLEHATHLNSTSSPTSMDLPLLLTCRPCRCSLLSLPSLLFSYPCVGTRCSYGRYLVDGAARFTCCEQIASYTSRGSSRFLVGGKKGNWPCARAYVFYCVLNIHTKV